MVKMATLSSHNPLRFKARDSYDPQSPVVEIQSNGWYLLEEWREKSTSN